MLPLQRQTFRVLRASQARFRWQARGRAPALSHHRAIPSEVLRLRMTSRLAPGGRFAFEGLSVHRTDFLCESRVNGVAPQFAHHGQESAFRRKVLGEHGEITNLAVM